MKISYRQKIIHWLPQIAIIFGLGITYSLSIAPGLSWANNGSDGGDLITAAATGGIAHPTGYPTYLIIARLFQLIPVGSIAFRTNLLSLVFAILTALLIYDTITNFPGPIHERWIAGLIGAFSFGLSPLAWSQAVITEVYTLQTFFEILILFLLISKSFSNHPCGRDLLIGIIFGLAMGNHLTTIFLLPLVLTVGVVGRKPNLSLLNREGSRALNKWVLNWRTLLFRCLGGLFGLLIYTSLYFRAHTGSPVIWGNPVTFKNFLWLVTGKLYSSELFVFPRGYFFIKLKVWVEIILKQGGIIGLLIGLCGITVTFIRRSTLEFTRSTIYLIVVYAIFSFIYTTSDSFIYLIFPLLVFSLWVGLGAAALIDSASRIHSRVGEILGVVLLLLLAVQGVRTFPTVDASKNDEAVVFGERMMTTLPPRAMVFTDGDKDSFTLWYYQYVLKRRGDIAVIVTNLLPYDWYRSNLQAIYPDLSIPENLNESWKTDIIARNKNRPICETIVVEQAQSRCWE